MFIPYNLLVIDIIKDFISLKDLVLNKKLMVKNKIENVTTFMEISKKALKLNIRFICIDIKTDKKLISTCVKKGL